MNSRSKLFVIAAAVAVLTSQHAVMLHAQGTLLTARTAGMSASNVAEVGHLEDLYQNPASLAFLGAPSVVLTHFQSSPGTPMEESATTPLLTMEGLALAVGVEVSHLGYLRIENGTDARMLEYAGDFAVGYEITSTVGLGALVRAGEAWKKGSSAATVLTSLGLTYSPDPGISYALVMRGLGQGIQGDPSDTSTILETVHPDKSLEVGIAMRFPSSASLREPIFVIALSNEKILGRDNYTYRIGLELLPLDFFTFRIGYGVDTWSNTLSFGAGLHTSGFHVDYAASYDGNDNLIHWASVSIDL